MLSEEKALRAQELREEAELRAERGEAPSIRPEIARLRKWKHALAEALVDGWHADWKMNFVVNRAWKLMDEQSETMEQHFAFPAQVMGLKYVYGADRAQVFIARHFRTLNEALWEGRKRDLCKTIALRTMGMKVGNGVAMFSSARERDKRHDWATVK